MKRHTEKNFKSIGNKVNAAMTTHKFVNDMTKNSFKAQTTRAVTNL